MEITSYAPSSSNQNRADILTLRNVAFGMKEEGSPIIYGINMNVTRFSLTMVIGKVGSGKSTLLKGLLGELPASVGSIRRQSTEAAYCEQQPWLINDNIRNNILGQSIFEAGWYQTVIKSCALDKDFAALPLGDLSRIGSKGISLSGGQKARVVSRTSSTLYYPRANSLGTGTSYLLKKASRHNR
jgi:ATP-binding cassette subfamily C (CFTR/MRP) protein 1